MASNQLDVLLIKIDGAANRPCDGLWSACTFALAAVRCHQTFNPCSRIRLRPEASGSPRTRRREDKRAIGLANAEVVMAVCEDRVDGGLLHDLNIAHLIKTGKGIRV